MATDFETVVEDAVRAELSGEVKDELDAVVASSVDRAFDEKVDSAVETAVQDQLPEITDAVESRLDDRFERLDSEFQEKIEDVRERVIQLKRELDAKAPADHDHEAFETIGEIEAEIDELQSEFWTLESELNGRQSDTEDAVDDLQARVDDAEDKLKRVAWVVSDLRDERGSADSYQKAVNRLKRAAAQEGISTATCENCGESVDVSLLTDPECPHCSATVSDVRPDGGIFRKKARLVTASQLESGDDDA